MINGKTLLKKRDLIFILIWPIIAAILSLLLKANILVSILLFMVIPSAYLSIININAIRKAAIFSFALSIPLAIIVDHIMEQTGGWFLPYSVFGSLRILEFVTIEQIIWLLFYLYFIVMFYETFLEKECANKPYFSKFKYLIITLYLSLGLFVMFHFLRPELLKIDYFYLKFGLIFGALPVLLMFLKFPALYSKLLRAGAYFFYFSFIYEITALNLGQWEFPAANQLIGYINLFGLKFPYEELIFWMILGGIGALVYYEFFDDDLK